MTNTEKKQILIADLTAHIGQERIDLDHVQVTDSFDTAMTILSTGSIDAIYVCFDQELSEAEKLFSRFQSFRGCIAENMVAVCSSPGARTLAALFEIGIDCWLDHSRFITDPQKFLRFDTEREEHIAKTLALVIRNGEQAVIESRLNEVLEVASFNYKISYMTGKAYEALGIFSKAIEAYKRSHGQNKLFKPAANLLGEALLVMGRIDEAMVLFEGLDRMFPFNAARKANLACVAVEQNDLARAETLVEEAKALDPTHSKVIEARAQLCLVTGKINEALKLLDEMSEVGPFFAAKINELGIKLSQAGKGQNALQLYKKAHKIVRPELRYKISLNAALACRRQGDWDETIKYLDRCTSEYGGTFPKLDKIRHSVERAKREGLAPPSPKGGMAS